MTPIGQRESAWPWRTDTAQTSLGPITVSTTLTTVTGASTRSTWLTGQCPAPLLQQRSVSVCSLNVWCTRGLPSGCL